MNSQDFTFWLQGYVELGGKNPDDKQWEIIKEHLALVFKKVTPTTYCASPVDEKICSMALESMQKRPDIFGDIYKPLHSELGSKDWVNITCGIPQDQVYRDFNAAYMPITNPTILATECVIQSC